MIAGQIGFGILIARALNANIKGKHSLEHGSFSSGLIGRGCFFSI